MNFWTALGVYILFFVCYWFLVWSIYWHIKQYTMPQDHSSLIVQIFMVVIAILSIGSTILFFALPFSS